MSSPSFRVGAVVAALTSLLTSAASAQTELRERAAALPLDVRVHDNGTVTVNADGVPLQRLLAALQPACAMDVRLDTRAGTRAVSLAVAELPPGAAVAAVLEASGLDFAMHTRCGSPGHPALVVVRASSDAIVLPPGPAADPDDPQVKDALAPELAAGPPPAVEVREDPEAPTTSAPAAPRSAREPGEVTAAQLVDLLRVAPGARGPVIALPFTDRYGQQFLQVRPTEASAMIPLPFPDVNGNPVAVPRRAAGGPPPVEIPVVGPGAPVGSPVAPVPPVSVNPADHRRPGGDPRQP